MTDLPDKLLRNIKGGFWKVEPVTVEPELILRDWCFLKVNKTFESLHLMGYVESNMEGRVSSAVASFDKETMQAITASGRIYKLEGASRYNYDADYVLRHWLKRNNLTMDNIEFLV